MRERTRGTKGFAGIATVGFLLAFMMGGCGDSSGTPGESTGDGTATDSPADVSGDSDQDAVSDGTGGTTEPTGPWPPYGQPTDPWEGVEVPACAPLGSPGPYAVGVREIEVDGVPAEVWYPSDEVLGESPRWDFYDLRDWLPAAEREKIPDDEVPLLMTRAVRDLPVASEGSFPLLLFSHGFASFRFQSTYWTVHMASHGFVVASVDHPARNLRNVIAFNLTERDRTLAQLFDVVEELTSTAGDPLEGRIDLGRVAVSGHSAGGNAAAAALANERFSAGVLFTPAGSPPEGTGDTRALIFAGETDGITPPENVRNTYAGLEGIRYWLNVRNAGHLAFSDLCLVGREDGGLVGVASRYGVNNASFFADLATDGCTEEDLPAEQTWALQNHAGALFLMDALGLDGAAEFDLESIASCFADILLEAEGPVGPGPLPGEDDGNSEEE